MKWGETGMKAIITSLFTVLLFHSTAFAYTYNQNECSQIVNVVNKTLPMSIDQATQLVSSVCSVISGKATFTYNYELNIMPQGKLPRDFKQKVVKKFCSNPDTRAFLDGLTTVKMDYYLQSGNFYDRIEFSKRDCN